MKTFNLLRHIIICLVAANLTLAGDLVKDRTSIALDDSISLEIKGGPMIANVATSCLIIKKKNEKEFEIARWTKDYNTYLKIGLEIPSSGVYPGISIVDAKMANKIVAAVVKYETVNYIIVALMDEKRVSKPKLMKDMKDGRIGETINEIKKRDKGIEVTFSGGRKEIITLE